MAESLFIKVDEVGELLGISRAEAYRIIRKREPSIHDSFSYVITLSINLVCIQTSNMMLIPKRIMQYYCSLVQYFV